MSSDKAEEEPGTYQVLSWLTTHFSAVAWIPGCIRLSVPAEAFNLSLPFSPSVLTVNEEMLNSFIWLRSLWSPPLKALIVLLAVNVTWGNSAAHSRAGVWGEPFLVICHSLEVWHALLCEHAGELECLGLRLELLGAGSSHHHQQESRECSIWGIRTGWGHIPWSSLLDIMQAEVNANLKIVGFCK